MLGDYAALKGYFPVLTCYFYPALYVTLGIFMHCSSGCELLVNVGKRDYHVGGGVRQHNVWALIISEVELLLAMLHSVTFETAVK